MIGQTTAARGLSSLPMRLLALLLIVIVGAGGIVYFVRGRTGASTAPTYQTAQVSKGNVSVVVAATGPISTAQSIPLTFKQNGKITEILVKPGDKVTTGEVLAKEDATDFQNTLNQTTATLDQQKAALAKLTTGPTPQQIAVSQQAINSAQSNLANAQKNVQLVADQNAKDLQTAQVTLANAQQSLADAQANYQTVQNELAKSVDADRQAVANAQTALSNAQKNYNSVQAQIVASTQADQVALQNAQQSLNNAKQNQASTAQQVAAALQADATAVQNAQRAFQNTQATLAAGTPVQQQQLAQANNDLNTAQISRDAACNLGNHANSQAGCDAANAAVNTKLTAITSIQAQIQQTQTQGQQTLATAQSALKTAEDAANSDKARQQATSLTAQQAVDQATNALKTAQAALNNDTAKFQGNVVQAQTSIDSAQGALKTAQTALASDGAKNSAQLQAAQQQIDTATSGVKTAQTALDGQTTKAASALQAAQATVDADTQAVKTAQAALAQLQAPPTQADLDAARAQVENATAALQTAQANVDSTVLKSPIDATIAQVNGNTGQYLAGGSVSAVATNGAANGFILLNNLSTLQVIAQVNEADMAKINLGEPVDFTIDAFPTQTFTGKVAVIQPLGAVQQNIVNYNVTSTIDPTTTKLLPGMTANVNIVTDQRTGVLVVPSAALSFARTQLQRQAAAGTPIAGGPNAARSVGGSASVSESISSSLTTSRNGTVSLRSPATGVGGASGTLARGGAGGTRTAQGTGTNTAAQGNQAQRGQRAAAGSATSQTAALRAPILVMENGTATLRLIQVGLSDGRNTEVVSGLSAGQTIVIGTGSVGGARPTSPAVGGRPGGGGGAFGGRGG